MLPLQANLPRRGGGTIFKMPRSPAALSDAETLTYAAVDPLVNMAARVHFRFLAVHIDQLQNSFRKGKG